MSDASLSAAQSMPGRPAGRSGRAWADGLQDHRPNLRSERRQALLHGGIRFTYSADCLPKNSDSFLNAAKELIVGREGKHEKKSHLVIMLE